MKGKIKHILNKPCIPQKSFDNIFCFNCEALKNVAKIVMFIVNTCLPWPASLELETKYGDRSNKRKSTKGLPGGGGTMVFQCHHHNLWLECNQRPSIGICYLYYTLQLQQLQLLELIKYMEQKRRTSASVACTQCKLSNTQGIQTTQELKCLSMT